MDQLAEERNLREAGSANNRVHFILTTHRVRLRREVLGRGEVTSIMLDHVVSCKLTQSSIPTLLLFAGLAVLFGLFQSVQQGAANVLVFWIVIGGILGGIYLLTRQQVLELASAGATLRLSTNGLRRDALEGLIDAIERAKQDR